VVQMMLATIGGKASVQHTQQAAHAMLARRMLGLAVVSSGYAVIVAQGLAHLLGH
jgi:hypothetical protein